MLPNCVSVVIVLALVASSLINYPAMAQPFRQQDPVTISENIIYVKVQVNGRGPYNFMLDPGVAEIGRLDQRLAKELGLNIVGFEENSDGYQQKREFLVGLDKLALGQVAHSNLKLKVGDFNATPKKIPIDGILGRDFFYKYLLTIDGPGRQLIVSRANLDARTTGVLSYTKAFLVSGQVGQKAMGFAIDPGSDLPLLLPKSSLAGIHYVDTANERVVTKAAISFVLREAVVNDEVVLGALTLQGQTVYYSDKAHQITAGEAFLKEHTISLDQQKKLVRIE